MTTTAVTGAATGLRIEALAAPRAEPARDGSPPDDQALARILETATTVPDHGGLRPWRFAVVSGAGRDRLGDALVAGLHRCGATTSPKRSWPRCGGRPSPPRARWR